MFLHFCRNVQNCPVLIYCVGLRVRACAWQGHRRHTTHTLSRRYIFGTHAHTHTLMNSDNFVFVYEVMSLNNHKKNSTMLTLCESNLWKSCSFYNDFFNAVLSIEPQSVEKNVKFFKQNFLPGFK